MKKILIDSRRKINSGIGRVSQWLVSNLDESLFSDVEIWYLANTSSMKDYDFKSEKVILTDAKPLSLGDIYEIPSLAVDNDFDLYINPQINTSPFHLIPFINIIHDFWPLTNIEWLPSQNDLINRFELSNLRLINNLANWLTVDRAKKYLTEFGFNKWKGSLKYNNIISKYAWSQYTAISAFATHICFASENTKKTSIELFNRNNNMSVINNGIKLICENVNKKRNKHFLNLSKLEERKNLYGLIDAYEIYANIVTCPYPLIIAGDPGYDDYSKNVIKRIEELNIKGIKIKFIPSANDNRISNLFEESAALIFTSFFEGFGLPPIEAMAAEVPVISSKTGIIMDGLNKYATILTENTPDELAEIMKDITENPEQYKNLAAIGKQKVKQVVDNQEIRNKWITLINKFLFQNCNY